MSFYDQFDRIAVLDTPSRPERKAESLREFAAQGIADRVRHYNGERRAAPLPRLNQALAGSLLSHLGVIREAKEDRVRQLLFFEDDVQFVRPVPEGDLPVCDLFYFGFWAGPEAVIAPYAPSYLRLLKDCRGLHAIVIPASSFDWLLARPAVENFSFSYSLALQMEQKLCLCFNPPVAFQRDGISTTTGGSRTLDEYVSRYNSLAARSGALTL